ncbi:MAG: hypothetical protein KGY38_07845, partial [Desulfobacterales bacterium]|nr:hypothetical protein [Desulfobacterales bacterium]
MKAKTMHKKMPTGTALTLIIALCSLIAAPPLFAQNYGGEQGQPAQQQYRQQQERYQQGQQEQPQQGQEYQQQREQQMQQQKTKTDFSEEKLKKFVKADEAVDEVQESY